MNTKHLLLFANSLLAPVLFAGEPIRVSSFSTILTEVVEQVGGDRVVVTAHVKPGVDPHDFEPRPKDLKTVSESQLVLLSARHMEGYVGKLREATGGKGNIVEVGNQFPALKMKVDPDHDHDHGHDHPEGVIEDPHWWHSVANVRRAAKVVRDELTKLSPSDRDQFSRGASAYIAKLDALQSWIKTKLSELPRDRRKLVTSHDAFQYFAKDFGFTIYAVEGISSTDQPSSKKVAETIALIREQRVKAVFLETLQNPKVITEITRESGAKIGGTLCADGLAEGELSTYEGMMKHNVATIVDALK